MFDTFPNSLCRNMERCISASSPFRGFFQRMTQNIGFNTWNHFRLTLFGGFLNSTVKLLLTDVVEFYI